MSTSIRPIGSPFRIEVERVMGSQCTTCNGRGWVTPPITSADGNVSAGDLVKMPCPNPACTVGKEKLGRDQFNKLSRMDKVLGTIKATVSVMPPMTNQYQFSETVTVTNVKAIDILDAVFEAAHQRIDEYQNMAIIMMDIDGNHYSFTSKDRPECGRLTTERKPKEQPTVTPQERAALEAIPFGDEPKLSDVFKRDETINPDADNAPNVANVKPPNSAKNAPKYDQDTLDTATDFIKSYDLGMAALVWLAELFPDGMNKKQWDAVKFLETVEAKAIDHATARVVKAFEVKGLKAGSGNFNAITGHTKLVHAINVGMTVTDILKKIADYQPPAPPEQIDTPEPPRPQPKSTNNVIELPALGWAANVMTTLTGVPIQDIGKYLNREYPREAQKEIRFGAMKGNTDINPYYVRARCDEVFGMHGIGWRLQAGADSGTSMTPIPKKRKDGSDYTEYEVCYTNWVFEYRVLVAGQLEWVSTTPITDTDSNESQSYAYRGAFSSLLKQAVRNMGGFDHLVGMMEDAA